MIEISSDNLDKDKIYSFCEIIELKGAEKFIYKMDEINDKGEKLRKFFQFKVTLIDSGENDLRILQIVDISDSILYNEQKAQNELL